MFFIQRTLQHLPRSTPMRAIRAQSTVPPTQPPKRKGPTGNFYKEFSRPLIKNLMYAILTYQVLYYTWSKLESIEIKQDKEDQIKSLEGELRSLTSGKST